jgi:hypothetical protein
VITDLPGTTSSFNKVKSSTNATAGLQDTNLARVKAAQEYLTRCDHVFIVVRIQRAITDYSVKSSLHAAIAQNVPLGADDSPRKALEIAIICTRSEVLQHTHTPLVDHLLIGSRILTLKMLKESFLVLTRSCHCFLRKV